MAYLILKYLHSIGASVLLGTGAGIDRAAAHSDSVKRTEP
jgi:uncharacterized membrane protein